MTKTSIYLQSVSLSTGVYVRSTTNFRLLRVLVAKSNLNFANTPRTSDMSEPAVNLHDYDFSHHSRLNSRE